MRAGTRGGRGTRCARLGRALTRMLVLAAVLTGVLAMHIVGHTAGHAVEPVGGQVTATQNMPGMDMPRPHGHAVAAVPALMPALTPVLTPAAGPTAHDDAGCTAATMCLALLSAAAAAALVRARSRATVRDAAARTRTPPGGAVPCRRPPSLVVLSVCRT